MKLAALALSFVSMFCSAAFAQPADDPAKLQSALDRDKKILQDWPALSRYAPDNAKLAPPAHGEHRVVFMGDSITDAWIKRSPAFFEGKPHIDRGISGQTTPQMLIRFRPDVIALKPEVVVILAGTNDIAGNTGPMTLDMIEDNFRSMVELAKANHIKVVLSSVMPVCDYIRPQTEHRPPAQIIALNEWLKDYATKNKLVYLDYYSAMLDDQKMLKKEITYDGLHPNEAGYAIMEPLAEKAISTAQHH
ncbi:MAG TPA: SGNH/GDSL hydrolase family protein [Bryobacteraceae bacterium]|nr:SGNH/GDSL hydrolase family protein [Bryobacteraceae bacterium]